MRSLCECVCVPCYKATFSEALNAGRCCRPSDILSSLSTLGSCIHTYTVVLAVFARLTHPHHRRYASTGCCKSQSLVTMHGRLLDYTDRPIPCKAGCSMNNVHAFLGPFHGAIAVPSVTRCRCRVVVVVVDIDAQAACDSGGSSDTW